MTDFCVATLAPAADLAGRHGVWRGAALARCADAELVARGMLAAAHAEADAVARQARGAALAAEQAVERRTLQRAAELLQGLQGARAALLLRTEELVVDLARALFERLVLEATPRQRVEAALRRLLQEAPPKLAEALLYVHPDDAALLPALDWELRHDPALAPGTCRLEAASGEWRADFGAAVAALGSALAAAAVADPAVDGREPMD
ncbi:FliH/SctL family protein [Rugamonas rubra]|uniref:Flagellar biosynthesis/type III secretory pathway protein FliH n=1 Tax=Rugamonas rubra TaxID=758825 RepID=A0A1I4M5B5_9BURK|nr:FliH/SctL family protein [Rugamonas rubra]SFL98177.1 Flagellar biosynthesis/type III secretory pathway protein FliH [Rugamonas rubra]